ncbi:class I SAM-dependent methyltransferase [Ktedonosporobacter rubrisoli]|uniref:Class I SAM-dependent methyltransferase n=1 Tax=Ktedonosporobacter rubrisoli TaxID=2509675 RepID=A0A4P6JQW5_KTERU|nr:class I SAM-dependent methyltransferase [Ktedonosporobacter rubrisoli]QBD77580.1 class I SAM-dependent methyltransferase [Ktedonosporobacter rubrisoli]
MPILPDHTHDKTAYFTDPESASEMARLTKQARLLTEVMGGPLAEQAEPALFQDIIDLACGPGEWVLEVAFEYPDKQVTGVDVSQLMIDYARFQVSQHKLNNAHFKVMDILKPLEFEEHSFDLVNIRLIASFMFRSLNSWPMLIQECVRITRPGGVIRLTDCEWFISNSPMTEKLFGLCTQAIHMGGNAFSPDGRHIAITPMLGRFLRNAGCQNVQHRAFAVDCSAGARGHQSFYEDMMVFLKLVQPLLLKAGIATQEEADVLYLSALDEMRAEDFNCIWYYLTVWGETAIPELRRNERAYTQVTPL